MEKMVIKSTFFIGLLDLIPNVPDERLVIKNQRGTNSIICSCGTGIPGIQNKLRPTPLRDASNLFFVFQEKITSFQLQKSLTLICFVQR